VPLDYRQTWIRDLLSVDLQYMIYDNWSAYAQYARGFLAPNLNVLYVVNPAMRMASSLAPPKSRVISPGARAGNKHYPRADCGSEKLSVKLEHADRLWSRE
jgi:hypothetical protein